MVCFEVCLPHMSACELVQGDEHKIAPHVYPCDPMVADRVGGQLFRRARNFYGFTRISPRGNLYNFTPIFCRSLLPFYSNTQFFIGVQRVRE